MGCHILASGFRVGGDGCDCSGGVIHGHGGVCCRGRVDGVQEKMMFFIFIYFISNESIEFFLSC